MTNDTQQTNFQVYSLQTIEEGKENKYVHWADGLTMYIIKDNVTMILDENEIQQLIKALPKTVGGTY
jgi:sulfur transfer complex TusBCD TusB component (DsrH family)